MPYSDMWPDKAPSYVSTARAPADFDAFWHATLAEARAQDLVWWFEEVDSPITAFRVADVSFAGFGGNRIRAWLITPKTGASSCVVKYIGYGGGRSLPHMHLLWPAAGRAVLVMDTRGQGSSWSTGDTPDPVGSDPQHPGFMTRGVSSRETYYYRRVFVDAVKAVEVARRLPGIDPARVAVAGGSQGGGISLAVAGLMPDLAACMPDVPYLCDFRRATGVASRDPYLEINRYLSVHREQEERTFATLSYFDGVHFSARAKAKALFSVALMDTICPPTTVYAAYNAYAGEKAIEAYHFNDHEGGGPLQEARQVEWLNKAVPI